MKTQTRNFLAGIGYFGQGFAIVFRSPKMLLLGALPAVLVSALLIVAIVLLSIYISDIATWLTPFADNWAQAIQVVVRVVAGGAVLAGALTVSLLGFTAITLAVGGPFYESIAERVEDGLGGAPGAVDLPWWKSAGIGLRDGIAMIALAIMYAIPLFLAGFIPVLGQTVVPVIAVCVNASLLAVELAGIPFTRRSISLRERRTILGKNRALVLGFAIPTYLLCLIPLAALVVIPAAMAGGTALSHQLLSRTHDARSQVRSPSAAW